MDKQWWRIVATAEMMQPSLYHMANTSTLTSILKSNYNKILHIHSTPTRLDCFSYLLINEWKKNKDPISNNNNEYYISWRSNIDQRSVNGWKQRICKCYHDYATTTTTATRRRVPCTWRQICWNSLVNIWNFHHEIASQDRRVWFRPMVRFWWQIATSLNVVFDTFVQRAPLSI